MSNQNMQSSQSEVLNVLDDFVPIGPTVEQAEACVEMFVTNTRIRTQTSNVVSASSTAMEQLNAALLADVENIRQLGQDFTDFDKYMAGANLLESIAE